VTKATQKTPQTASRHSSQRNGSRRSPSKFVVLAAALVAALATAGWLVLSPSSNSAKVHPVTTTTLNALERQAVVSTAGFARSAIFATTTPVDPITSAAVLVAAEADKGTLLVVRNLGQVPRHPRMVVLAWYFSVKPVLSCVNLPRFRSGQAVILPCPGALAHLTLPTHP